MKLSVAQLSDALWLPKRLLGVGRWTRVNDTLRITSSLEAGGVVMPGVTFFASCMAQKPDEKLAVMLMTEVGLKQRPFARVDWRGALHQNNDKACGDLRNIDAGRTHFHDIDLHHHIGVDELFQSKCDLPIAVKIEPEPASFKELLEIAADLLHIENLTGIPTPPWEAPRTSLI